MAKLLHDKSLESVDSGLDIFSVPTSQTSIERGDYVEYLPISTIGDGPIVEFSINNKGTSDYIDLAHTYLHCKVRITDSKGANLAPEIVIAPVNNFLHSLWAQVDISFNNTLVTSSENTYPYRAYLENLLEYGRNAKKSQLTTQLYYRDTSHHFEDLKQDGKNSGFITRYHFAKTSKVLDLIGRLHSDVFHMDQYLLNGVDIKIRLLKSSEAFHLLSNVTDGTTYKTKLDSVRLFVRKVAINPVVALAHAKCLDNKTTAKYPIKRVAIKTFSVPQGQLSVTKDNLFLTQIPTRILIGFVDSEAYNGDYAKNPFNFKHLDISYLCLYVDGKQIPQTPLTPDFGTRQYARSYQRLYTELGMIDLDSDNFLEYRDFDGGNTVFAFNLTPTAIENKDQVELIRTGPLRVEAKFKKPLPKPHHVIVYGEMDSLIEITGNREVITDFI